MRRPIRARVWFTPPQWYWFGWPTLVPWHTGGDEFDWHTLTLGWTVTGRINIATRPCPMKGKCADITKEMRQAGEANWRPAEWPIDVYGNDHTDPNWMRRYDDDAA